MEINFSTIMSVLSFIVALYVAITNSKRNNKQDTKSDASEMTTVIVKLENIGNGITEIKSEMKTIKTDMKEDHDRIIRVEESAKQAHKRIDELQHNHE